MSLERAFAVARRIAPRATSPNPRVGCVLVKGGKIVAEGAHVAYGAPHAEPTALKKAGKRAKGATAYLTMEPCASFKGKRNPSCAQTLAAAGVKHVICASLDPNPKVAGRGLALLRRAGVKAVLEKGWAEEAERLNRGFFSRMRRRRPWVILKTALSLDGKASTPNGKSRWVTGNQSRTAVHRLRAEVDAILVGAGTVLADNPALTSHGAGANPLRVVVAGRRRIPRKLRIFDSSAKTVVYKPEYPARGPKAILSITALLWDLAERYQVGTLLVEGGPTIHASFLKAGVVDEVRVFLAPKMLSGAADPNTAPRLKTPKVSRVGDDWLIEGTIHGK